MSKPLNISQHANAAAKGVPTTGAQSAIQDSEGKLLRTTGSVGCLQAGGAVLESRNVISIDASTKDHNLTPDYLMGGDIFLSNATGNALQLPNAIDIVRYLGHLSATPSSSYATGVIVNPANNAAIDIPTPGVLIPSFEFTIYLLNGDTATLQQNGGMEIRVGGLGTTATADYALVAGGAVGAAKGNRFRGYVLNSAEGLSALVVVVPLDA